jgi:hypothetical protein
MTNPLSSQAQSSATTLDQYFERIVVINLPQRLDRRREMEAQLRNLSLQAEFFPAVQVTVQDDWPSLGARGCFLSHYTVLKNALESGVRNVLILEDDLDFSPSLPSSQPELLSQISTQPWDFLYLGHIEPVPSQSSGDPQLLLWTTALQTLHFYAVNQTVLPRLVAYLEQVQSRPDGHPLGGPQHVDGAISMFRAQNPDVTTLIASPAMGSQRSSLSDITRAWYDDLPIVGKLVNTARRLRRSILARS